MKSPFPGMDPFIEARGLWADFHQRLMSRLADQISEKLPPQYVARLGHRTYIDRVVEDEESDVQNTHFEPDVSVLRHGEEAAEGGHTIPSPQPGAVVMHAEISGDKVKDVYVDIFDVNPGRRLVTSIEVLSPANKRYRGTGWEQYRRKRDLLLQGRANLIEIDLLRRGRRHPMRERWPDSPYYVLVSRMWEIPACNVWPVYTTVRLPELHVPLEQEVPEVAIDLQNAIDEVYGRSRYGEDINYEGSIFPPLTQEERSLLSTTP